MKHEPMFSTKEVAKMFGYSRTSSVHNAVARGTFPKPDVYMMIGYTSNPLRAFWVKKTLDAEKARRKARE